MRSRGILVASLTSLAMLTCGLGTVPAAAESYELEFRSRPSEYFGHSYVVARKVGASGRVISERGGGFDPAPGTPVGQTLRGVPGVVHYTREDRATPPDERYRVRVSRGQYERAVAKIDGNSRRRPTFSVTRQNCNTFVGRVARAAGLRAPDRSFELPREYVRQMRELNGR